MATRAERRRLGREAAKRVQRGAKLGGTPLGSVPHTGKRVQRGAKLGGTPLGSVPHTGGDVVTADEDPYSIDTSVVDTTGAVLLTGVGVVSVLANNADGSGTIPLIALTLDGRVNNEQTLTRTVYMLDADAAGTIVAELVGIMDRAASGGVEDFRAALARKMAEVPR